MSGEKISSNTSDLNMSTNLKDPVVEDIDDLELQAVGYQRQMPRHFTLFSLMSLSFALSCTWSGTGSSVGISLTEASSAGTIWAIPIAGFMTAIVTAGMAELSSAYPVAGAQYYWSFMVSNEKYRPFAAYLNGWISVFGWWLGLASVCNFVASMILAMAVLWFPEYAIERWHQWMVYVALCWTTVLLNVFGSKLIPLFNQCILILACTSLTATFLTLLICSRNHYPSAEYIFTDTTNSTGWSNNGFAFMLAITNAVYSFLGTDAAAHLCEEIPNPGKNVPKVMLWPILMGLLTAWPFAVSCMAAIVDVDAVLHTATGLPLLEIYYQGTGSRAAATVLMILFAICFYGCAVANGTTSSRTLWAISRDGALPFSNIWMRVSKKYAMPVNAMCLSATMASLYGLIFIGSSTAFSAMVGANIIFLQTSCVIPQAILLYRGRDKVLPKRHFSLGRYGKFVNATAVLWVVALDIIYFIPTLQPVTVTNMNYVSVVTSGIVTFIFVLWFTTKRNSFKGPAIDMELVRMRREEALHQDEVVLVAESSASGERKSANE